jgi:hypothetical protein
MVFVTVGRQLGVGRPFGATLVFQIMADNQESSARNRAPAFVAALVIGLPLLYLLSTGPVLFVMTKTSLLGSWVSWELVAKFYWPVEWLYKNTFMKEPLDLYLQLWGLK